MSSTSSTRNSKKPLQLPQPSSRSPRSPFLRSKTLPSRKLPLTLLSPFQTTLVAVAVRTISSWKRRCTTMTR